MIPIVQPMASYGDAEAIAKFARELVHSLWKELGWHVSDTAGSKLIVIKPNWVQESHEQSPAEWESIITHPALVLAVVRALAERLCDRGCIAVCDAPQTYADFQRILDRGGLLEGLNEISMEFPHLGIEVLDLRREIWVVKEQVVVERISNRRDPRGYVRLNLGQDSLFYEHSGEGRYYGADYDTSVVNRHHKGITQEYIIAGTPMACDLFVNLPKLKTHKKTGITCSLKNLVGINGDKNWLPHHTEGSPATCGDEFRDNQVAHTVEMQLKNMGRKFALSVPILGPWGFRKIRNAGKSVLGDSESVVRNGNWHGNDTCWRMALDLNRALLYGNMDGSWKEAGHKKNYLSIVDGIIGGEGNGPLCPEPVNSGVLIAGTNAAQVDAIACQVMGYDVEDVPIVREAFARHRWPISTLALEDLQVQDMRTGNLVPLNRVDSAVSGSFRPHFGWTESLCKNSKRSG
jgi:uncharacterized protein (DUF362 family)